jgi:hypothetical protein
MLNIIKFGYIVSRRELGENVMSSANGFSYISIDDARFGENLGPS